MRIVFWNIRAGGGVRVARIAAQLKGWAPDAVALCEFRATPPSLELARALAALGLGHRGTTPHPAQPSAARRFIAGRGLLTRISLRARRDDAVRLPLHASVDAPRPRSPGTKHVPK